MNVDGTYRLYDDLEVICYQNAHWFLSYAVALPAIIIWGLGIPTFGLIIIYKNRDKLKTMDVKSKFGFIYNGYRVPQAYYWEMVIMYRKIVIIFI